jgi:hypothetical protein
MNTDNNNKRMAGKEGKINKYTMERKKNQTINTIQL